MGCSLHRSNVGLLNVTFLGEVVRGISMVRRLYFGTGDVVGKTSAMSLSSGEFQRVLLQSCIRTAFWITLVMLLTSSCFRPRVAFDLVVLLTSSCF